MPRSGSVYDITSVKGSTNGICTTGVMSSSLPEDLASTESLGSMEESLNIITDKKLSVKVETMQYLIWI